MRTTAFIGAVIASAAMMGCGGMQIQGGPAPTSTCENTALCEISVSVSGCTVKIPPDKQVIAMKGNYVAIIWQLDTDAVKDKFQFDNVVLKSNTPDNGHWYTGKQFSGQKAINNKTGFFWIDRNSDYSYYEYTIDLLDTVNNRHCKLDPMFANN